MDFWGGEVYHDQYGRYQIVAETTEDGLIYQWRNYERSSKIQGLGGRFANWCEDGRIKFYRSAYLRDRAYPKFTTQR